MKRGKAGSDDPAFFVEKQIDRIARLWQYNPARRRRPSRKEESPMSITETIALLMLVIAAVSLGTQIKK